MGTNAQDRTHPCHGCTAVPVDHAIRCPFLGVIAAGRHKRIGALSPEPAFEALHGLWAAPNKRRTIVLRSRYWDDARVVSLTTKTLVVRYSDEALLLAVEKERPGGPAHARATLVRTAPRAGRNPTVPKGRPPAPKGRKRCAFCGRADCRWHQRYGRTRVKSAPKAVRA